MFDTLQLPLLQDYSDLKVSRTDGLNDSGVTDNKIGSVDDPTNDMDLNKLSFDRDLPSSSPIRPSEEF